MNKLSRLFIVSIMMLASLPLLNAQNTSYDVAPVFGQGKVTLVSFMQLYCTYPEKAAASGKQGVVILNIAISAKGENGKATVKQSVSPELDQEALRVASLFPDWTPAQKDGKAVACTRDVPFVFKLTPDATSANNSGTKSPLYVVNGKKVTGSLNVDPSTITSIRVKKGKPAIDAYGVDATDGAIIITTK